MKKIKKTLALSLVLVMAFMQIVNAKVVEDTSSFKYEVREDRTEPKNVHWSAVGYIFPHPNTYLGPKTEAYINNFKTNETKPQAIIRDIIRAIYAYGVDYDGTMESPTSLDNKKGRCFQMVMFASKLFERTSLPYKIVMTKSYSKDGKTTGHTYIVTLGDESKPYVFEATWFNKNICPTDLTENILTYFDGLMAKQDFMDSNIHKDDIDTKGVTNIDVYVSEWLNNGVKTKDKKEPMKLDKRTINMNTVIVDYFTLPVVKK